MNDKQKEDIRRNLRLVEGSMADIQMGVEYIRDVLDETDEAPEEVDIPL